MIRHDKSIAPPKKEDLVMEARGTPRVDVEELSFDVEFFHRSFCGSELGVSTGFRPWGFGHVDTLSRLSLVTYLELRAFAAKSLVT